MRKLVMIRSIFVFLHRWVGLLMTAFLVFVGLTGSILAFSDEIERLVAPQLFATPRPGVPPLDMATLMEKAAFLVPPKAQLLGVQKHRDDRATLFLAPELDIDPETGKAKTPTDPKTGKLDMKAAEALMPPQILIDPWTGAELGRRRRGDLSEGLVNLVPFIFYLHYTLKPLLPPPFGQLLLGVIAVLWTLDCFVGFYLTLPASNSSFWRKWRPAWAIKRSAGAYRLNFDLHRASGLWLWLMLLVFAWSAVMFNMGSVYKPVMTTLFDYVSPKEQDRAMMQHRTAKPHPSLDWRAADAVGAKLMAEQAIKRGFVVGAQTTLLYLAPKGLYVYGAHSSLDVSTRGSSVMLQFDGDTGELLGFTAPSGEHTGNTIEAWLRALHNADVFGLPYKIFVCALGLVIAMLSVTGVYIWWKKRKARRFRKSRGADAPLEGAIVD
jgi:uncharacterized iron-regulated membrane protein